MKPLISDEYLTPETNDTPRQKCCEACAFLKSDPQQLQCNPQWSEWVEDWRAGNDVFYCVHTTDDKGRNQVCAGFHALYGRHIPLPFWAAPASTGDKP
jgi:hypothetical protein